MPKKRRSSKRKTGSSRSGKRRVSSVGSRLQVWKGSKTKTSGGLTKSDLMENKRGKIVSKKASKAATKEWKDYKRDLMLEPLCDDFTDANPVTRPRSLVQYYYDKFDETGDDYYFEKASRLKRDEDRKATFI